MANIDESSATFGNLLARMERVEKDMEEIKKGQAEILAILNQAQGGWRTMVTFGGGIAVLISALIAGISYYHSWWEK